MTSGDPRSQALGVVMWRRCAQSTLANQDDGCDDRADRTDYAAVMDSDIANEAFPRGSVVLISGIMAAGKSTVAQMLAERLPSSAHVRGDAFRRMIVSGRAEMVPSADAEAIRQLQLRYRIGAMTADAYANAGFTALYQDIVLGEDLAHAVDLISARPLFIVVLTPRPEAIAQRAEGRSKPGGYGEWTVSSLNELLRDTPHVGLWLDTSEQTAEQSVDEVVRRAADARVG